MTGLRDRIAYAIAQADGDEPGMEPASCDYEMADAVIQELGLRIEYGALDPTDSGRLSDDDDLTALPGETLKTRYITDWHPHVADAVITELRPQLMAWAQMCVDHGDMTPAAQRMLHKIVGKP